MSHLFMQLSDLPKIIIAEKYSLFICGLVYKEMKGLTLSITGYLIKKKKKKHCAVHVSFNLLQCLKETEQMFPYMEGTLICSALQKHKLFQVHRIVSHI